jgi:hypothetical protein
MAGRKKQRKLNRVVEEVADDRRLIQGGVSYSRRSQLRPVEQENEEEKP